MRSSALLLLAVPFLCCSPLRAQHRGYHVELSDGTTGWVILVNDSPKAIEAFHYAGTCGPGSDSYTYDSLDDTGDLHSHPAVSGRGQADVIEPGEHFFSAIKLLPNSCIPTAEITAVIYTDGTYEGDQNTLRGLQARRDGMRAAVLSWLQLFHGPGEREWKQSFPEQAKIVEHESFKKTMFPACRDRPIACEYWRGRNQIDRSVLFRTEQGKADPEASYAWIRNDLETHLRKIEADTALKVLDVYYPLPPELADPPALPNALPAGNVSPATRDADRMTPSNSR